MQEREEIEVEVPLEESPPQGEPPPIVESNKVEPAERPEDGQPSSES